MRSEAIMMRRRVATVALVVTIAACVLVSGAGPAQAAADAGHRVAEVHLDGSRWLLQHDNHAAGRVDSGFRERGGGAYRATRHDLHESELVGTVHGRQYDLWRLPTLQLGVRRQPATT